MFSLDSDISAVRKSASPPPDELILPVMPQRIVDLAGLNRFTSTVWGDPQALLEQLPPQGVEFINIEEFFDTLVPVFTSILTQKRILVRDEYRAALQTLQTAREYERGVCITGQPGIGKTYFLMYLLVTFLRQKQPVALHLLSGEPFYILFKDTATIHPVADVMTLLKCGFVWVLCDSNSSIGSPPGSFMQDPDRIRIIQTTPPEASRWREWIKQGGASCYIMDIWTENEIANLASLMELDVGRVIALARKWGCVPRTLLWAIRTSDKEVGHWYRDDAEIAIRQSQSIIQAGRSLDISSPSPFYFIQPRKLKSGAIWREFGSVYIPTKALQCMLAKGLQNLDDHKRLQFYGTLNQHMETQSAADYIYEFWSHNFVTAGEYTSVGSIGHRQ